MAASSIRTRGDNVRVRPYARLLTPRAWALGIGVAGGAVVAVLANPFTGIAIIVATIGLVMTVE